MNPSIEGVKPGYSSAEKDPIPDVEAFNASFAHVDQDLEIANKELEALQDIPENEAARKVLKDKIHELMERLVVAKN